MSDRTLGRQKVGKTFPKSAGCTLEEQKRPKVLPKAFEASLNCIVPLLNMSFGKNQPLKRILLDQGHCHIVCRPTEVCYLNSEADNTRVFLADGTWGSIDDSLIEMESVLPKDLFFRANRQNLINVDYVHSIAQGPGRDFIVNLKEPYSSIEFILTPEKKKELIEMLMYGSSSYQPE